MKKIDVDALLTDVAGITGNAWTLSVTDDVRTVIRQLQAEIDTALDEILRLVKSNDNLRGTIRIMRKRYKEQQAENEELRAQVARMDERIKQAENFPHDGKYNNGWHDCISYIKAARAK